MKHFDIYNHPEQGCEAVKHGFSWPAFFFGGIWALVKKIWGIAAVIIGVYLLLLFASIMSENAGFIIISLLLKLLLLLLYLVCGFKGNDWRRQDLMSRGFEKLRAIEATSSKEAIAAADSGTAVYSDVQMKPKRSAAWIVVFTMLIIQNIILLGLVFGKGIDSLDTILIFAVIIAVISWLFTFKLNAPEVVKELEKIVSINTKLIGYMFAIVLVAMTIIGLPVAAVAIYVLLIWYAAESIGVAITLFKAA